ncbi:MAG: CoB--CoM heterodisulfide reductase iron-sulfur subunit A family protein [Candidatus Tritonobacter lacicola]|nr:CoB--CoM heterodisulfide reductase iron-sulfur subunit A family protein [Candidatus Tritonobacter lacicola]
MKRIGVFVCHCGINIAATVDIERVVKEISSYPGVVYASDYKYMCSEPGQSLLTDKIKSEKLDGVVVAACSPTMHETTFRLASSKAGLNPYLCESANIREQDSWVHNDIDAATEKAIQIISSIIEKVRGDEPLEQLSVPITKQALVIGGGIAGMQAALDIANGGYKVILVEKEPTIGGRMAQLSETFPTLDCSSCILTPKMVEVGQHPNIEILASSVVQDVKGYIGNFTISIKRMATGVDPYKCNGCGLCSEKCPVKTPSEFELGLGMRPAIYSPFPQAIPNKPIIDKEHCLHYTKGTCGICQKICPVGAVDYDRGEEFMEKKIGAIVVATGYDLLPMSAIGEYGAGKLKNVITGLQFERLLSASGPTAGKVRRPSDGKEPKEVVFIQCAGSRDPEHAMAYCSKVCCMYSAKHAMLYKHRVHDGQPYIFYIDIRSAGKGYEEFVQRAMEDDGVFYIRGKVSKVFEEGDKVIVWGVDTLTGREIEIAADLVVLAMAMVPSYGTKVIADIMRVPTDAYGFINEAHPKLRPVESLTQGVFLAGCAQAPKDIPETVAQAGAAASKVLSLFSREELLHDPTVAVVDEEICTGCGMCVSLCPYEARELDEKTKVAKVNEILCQSCGACVSGCPSGATSQRNFSQKQYLAMLDSVL